MADADGCSDIRPEKNGITLVFFGRIEPELEDALANSLEELVGSLRESLPVRPGISRRYMAVPENIPPHNQERVFLSSLEPVGGNLVLGVTNTGFYDPYLGRHLFSYGRVGGSGVLSTYRFRKETDTRRQFLDRMGKQMVKTLALACTLDSCPDTGCIVSYHRWARDLDKNRYVCPSCRNGLLWSLAFFMESTAGNTPVVPGRNGEWL
ncbi:hypothetical protein [uncultured Methanoregula sp.]|uniref:hypothetical protein n=1 Tax=uncultured Methanoregula sp. TaxID=1005933 RepID=UPI002AAAA578|nr:hypothetical protein [uncultured Methanoregula sp.]